MPGDEQVVAPGQEADERDAERRVGERVVRERVLLRERRDDLGDHAHRRQDHDVDRGVRVEPEQVLEQHRVTAERRIEHPHVERVIERDQDHRQPEHRGREHLDDAGRVQRPDEDRHAEPAAGPCAAACGS